MTTFDILGLRMKTNILDNRQSCGCTSIYALLGGNCLALTNHSFMMSTAADPTLVRSLIAGLLFSTDTQTTQRSHRLSSWT